MDFEYFFSSSWLEKRPVSLQKLSKASTTIEHQTLLKFVANRGAAGNNKDIIKNDVMTIISNIAIFFCRYFDIEKSWYRTGLVGSFTPSPHLATWPLATVNRSKPQLERGDVLTGHLWSQLFTEKNRFQHPVYLFPTTCTIQKGHFNVPYRIQCAFRNHSLLITCTCISRKKSVFEKFLSPNREFCVVQGRDQSVD
jgi:hypothetical protein